MYVHVPFCRVRCGYCDFNTYTATELGGGANQAAYAETAVAEIALAARVLADAGRSRPVDTVFLGGGTPTLLPAGDLARMLAAVRDAWGLAPGAEVTTEANPDSVTPASLASLAAAGFTRVSFGMQSAVPHVLATLDRTQLAGCNKILGTSSMLLNGTLDDMLAICRSASEFVLVGPSAGLWPDALFERGVTGIAGTLVHDGASFAKAMAQGATWRAATRKFAISRQQWPGWQALLGACNSRVNPSSA